jgi:3-oxo-5-alpha-steroid 4-dehydrogenase 1
MSVNVGSDTIIRNLRKPGDTAHYLPTAGMFRYVTSANYFGEFLEWVGFAVLTWSIAGAVFALWTFANLAPRAARIHQMYQQEFPEQMAASHARRILPFIY